MKALPGHRVRRDRIGGRDDQVHADEDLARHTARQDVVHRDHPRGAADDGGDVLGRDVFYQAPLYPYSMALVYVTAGRDPVFAAIDSTHFLVVYRLAPASWSACA